MSRGWDLVSFDNLVRSVGDGVDLVQSGPAVRVLLEHGGDGVDEFVTVSQVPHHAETLVDLWLVDGVVFVVVEGGDRTVGSGAEGGDTSRVDLVLLGVALLDVWSLHPEDLELLWGEGGVVVGLEGHPVVPGEVLVDERGLDQLDSSFWVNEDVSWLDVSVVESL